MATNIDTGLTVQDAVHADHSPHIFTMSNGDLVAIYYDGTNLVWRSKSGGVWSAKTTITLDSGITPPKLSYWTRGATDVILGAASTDPIDATHNTDLFELTYTPSTHTLGLTNHGIDNLDGNLQIAGVAFLSGATTNDQFAELHGASNGGFATSTEWAATFATNGVDQVPTFTDYRSAARSGLVAVSTTVYLLYGCASTGTAFKVERFTAGTNADNVESPPAPAANPVGITACNDGTNVVFLINENNAKLRYLTRTGTNVYGTWTDILSDTGITGEPAVCVKANGDLAVFYRTTKNQANGEIWVVQRTSGTWGSPALLAGGAATGWNNPSCAPSDLNDSGNARLVYVTGTASPWTLVEDNYAFTSGSGPIIWTPAADSQTITDSGQWKATYTPPTESQTLAEQSSFALVPVLAADNQTTADSLSMAATYGPTDAQTNADSSATTAAFTAAADAQTQADSSALIALYAPGADHQTLAETDSMAAPFAPLADSQSHSDVVAMTGVWQPSPADAQTLADSVSMAGAWDQTPADAQTLGETQQQSGHWLPVDSTSHADSVAEVAPWAPAPADAQSNADSMTASAGSIGWNPAADAQVNAESIIYTAPWRPAADAQANTDSLAVFLTWLPPPVDHLSMTDSHTAAPAWGPVDAQVSGDSPATQALWVPAPVDALVNVDVASMTLNLPDFIWSPPADAQALLDSATYLTVPYVQARAVVRSGAAVGRVRSGNATGRVRSGAVAGHTR